MISKIRIKNFKAIKDSGEIILSPFTAIIGRNGSGKSSLIEAIEFLHDLVSIDLEYALQKWKSYESILYHGQVEKIEIDNTFIPQELITQNEETDESLEEMNNGDEENIFITEEEIENNYREGYINTSNLTGIHIKIDIKGDDYYQVSESFISQYLGDAIYIPWEQYHYKYNAGNEEHFERRDIDIINIGTREKINRINPFSRFKTILSYPKFNKFSKEIKKLQFLNINHYLIGNPLIKPFARDTKKLSKDGSNLYNILFWIFKTDEISKSNNFKNLERDFIEIIRYASEVRETITTDIQTQIFYSIFENRDQKNIEIPSWLLSTGSQKILALLSIIHNPEPSPLIIIEEFENGLDPWTISYLIKKFQEFIEKTNSQVIITTHSPTLLNILKFEEILFAKRENERGILEYVRFEEEKKMFDDIQENILPGELYEKIKKKEENYFELLDQFQKLSEEIKLKDHIKCLVFTEDEKKENTKFGEKYLIEIILESSGFDMKEVEIKSYKGVSNLKYIIDFTEMLTRSNYPNLKRIIFHCDRDVENDKDKIKYEESISRKTNNLGFLFYTKNYDVESYFLSPEHVNYIFPLIELERIKNHLSNSIKEKDTESLDKFIMAKQEEVYNRLQKEKGEKEKKIISRNQISPRKVTEELTKLYNENKERYIYGKNVFKYFCSFIESELEKNSNPKVKEEILQPTKFLKDSELEKIAQEIWG